MSARTATAEIAFGLPATGPEESSLRLEFAQEVDRLGYESMWFAHSITRDVPGLDTLEMLAAVAAITKRVKLGTNVLQLPLYHPVALARMLLTIDHISQGRLILGAGVGWIPKEFGNLGVPFKERGGRTAEALEILKRLWTEEEVTFEGRYYQIREVRLEPKPVQKPHPKILVGGGFKGDQRGAPGAFDGIGWNQTVIRRIARFGDGELMLMLGYGIYFQEYDRQQQTDLRKEQDEKMKEILKDIDDSVKKYAQAQSYTLVFNDRVLVYQDKSLDISDKIIVDLNKGYKK